VNYFGLVDTILSRHDGELLARIVDGAVEVEEDGYAGF
jgi:hypothetical protein